MNGRAVKGGFTLVEILVAIAIIVAIFSMVYGSYFAVSRSTEAYNAKMAESGDARQVLRQMTRQIRCAYIGPFELVSQQENKESKSIPNYFSGHSDEPSGEILHLVTTNAIFKDSHLSNGLFEVTYQFDEGGDLLYVSQERFTGTCESVVTERNWRLLARSIESVELKYFDGKKWLLQWDFKEQRQLPRAVKINLTFQNEDYQQYCYSTTAYICCQKNRDKKSLSETSISVNKL